MPTAHDLPTGRNLSNCVLRHTFATNLLELDCPVQAITMFLGHKNEKSTEPYLTPSETYLRSQIYRLNDSKNLNPV